jgi:hypothetical protein
MDIELKTHMFLRRGTMVWAVNVAPKILHSKGYLEHV